MISNTLTSHDKRRPDLQIRSEISQAPGNMLLMTLELELNVHTFLKDYKQRLLIFHISRYLLQLPDNPSFKMKNDVILLDVTNNTT